MRRHSRFASPARWSGHFGIDAFGLGSSLLSGRFPGFPRRTFSAVGTGYLPATPHTRGSATETDLLDAYPRLTHDDIQAALDYAADVVAKKQRSVTYIIAQIRVLTSHHSPPHQH
jgi:hypothetical protein